MSIFKTWYEKYRYNTVPAVWELFGLSILPFNQRVHFAEELQDEADVYRVDRILCPELFFGGFLRMVLYDFAHEEFWNTAEHQGVGDESWEMNSREKLFFELARDNVEGSTSKKAIAIILSDLSGDDYSDVLEYILGVYEAVRDDDPDDDPVTFTERVRRTCDRLESYTRWKVSNGDNRKFCAALEEFLQAPSLDKDSDVIHVRNLIAFCASYVSGNPEEAQMNRSFSDIITEYSDLRKKVVKDVVAQDSAVRKFINGLFNGEFRDKTVFDAPRATFLFVGPPGVGKTFLASTAGKIMNRPVRFFQMNEYAGENSYNGLIGFEPTWKNAKPGDLTEYVEEHPNAIMIFDEIEKAHKNTIHLFLSILEGGVLRDLCTQKDVDFKDTVVIFTTNAGRKFYESNMDIPLSSLPEQTLIDAIGDDKYNDPGTRIPPEILSRMAKGSIVGFDHIRPSKLIPIIKRGMKDGADAVRNKTGIEVKFDESILPYIFLYHMGEKLDARVAGARSRSFIIDSLYSISERITENKKELSALTNPDSVITASFRVENSRLANELTVPDRPVNILVVCNQEDYSFLFEHKSDVYKLSHVYAENGKDDYRDYINRKMTEEDIDAIIVDPYMRGTSRSEKTEKISGIWHSGTKGMEVVEWIRSGSGMPPVYCMDFNRRRKSHSIRFTDVQDLRNRGVRDIIHFSKASNKVQRTDILRNFAYELFLERKYDEMTSKGRTVAFEVGHVMKRSDDGKTVDVDMCITDLKLVRGMDAESQKIFIDDAVRMKGGFDRIIGADKAKEELRSFVKFLKDPGLFRRSGREVSRGLLMYGPPGTGKTMLARALACEADCPFIAIPGSQFADGTRKISEIFALARKYAPSVVCIDEIEAIAQNMGNPILKELLTEMDGFSKSDKPVFVIASTNAGVEPELGRQNIFLDPALLRRFTRKVYMKMPSRKDRAAFIEQKKKDLHGRTYNLDLLSSGDIAAFADLTAGKSLAELDNVFVFAIGRAAERGEKLTLQLLAGCFEETIYGEEKKYDPAHIRTTALHEAGHAFVGFACNDGTNNRFIPEYATIIARGGYLGLVRQKIDESLAGYSRPELIKLMRINLAGRASEMVFASKEEEGLTTGASNDLEVATIIAENILCRFGMEEGFLPSLSMDMIMRSPLAEKYVNRINEMMKRELDYTVALIKDNKDKVRKLAKALVDRSRLDTEEMKQILGL